MPLLKNTKILDANMILRFLLRDNEEMADTTEELIDNNDVLLTLEVAAEVVLSCKRFMSRSAAALPILLRDLPGLTMSAFRSMMFL